MSLSPLKSRELPDELLPLVDGYCAGTLSAREHAQLEALLRDNRAMQWAFLTYMEIHAGLHWGMRGADALPAEAIGWAAGVGEVSAWEADLPAEETAAPQPLPRPAARRTKRVLLTGGLLATAVALLVVIGLWTPAPEVASVARLVALDNAAWGAETQWAVGDPLAVGRLQLVRGVAQIETVHGVRMLLEGPADLQIVSADRCVLHSGHLVANVPPPAVGFQIDTPNALLIDQGTEFGVAVDPGQGTRLQVFDGIVDAQLRGPTATPRQRFTTGEAMLMEHEHPGQWLAVPFDPHRFIRHFPTPEERGLSWREARKPYNTSRHESIAVQPAPQGVVIDGDLSEWNAAGAFTAHCDPPYDATYHLTGMMMYDAEYLYLGAEVGDPLPLRSVLSPESDPTLLWKGGSVQVRLSTDRPRGWPLRNAAARPGVRDPSETLVHLTLWHYQPSGKSCLHVDYGMDFHGDRVNPPGWQGVFRPHADGRGYTMEYAVPWSLLSAADDPPVAGDTLAANWLVHWSDASGRVWRGQLVEICHPSVGGFTFENAYSWGQAHYR